MMEENSSEQTGERKVRDNRKMRKSMTAFRKRVCRLCAADAQMPDYKNPEALRKYITERGRILPQRITGTCAKHQRMVAAEIKKARILAYLPFDRK